MSGVTTAGMMPIRDNSTWTFDGTQWLNVPGNLAIPGDLQSGLLVYDSNRKRELYIVTVGMLVRTETWEWDGVSWQQNTSANTPRSLSQLASAAYSPQFHETVMMDTGFSPHTTWLYDGTAWSSIATAHEPAVGSNARLAYDPIRKSIVALTLNDLRTWVFDGKDWTTLPLTGAAPPTRQSPAVGFDPNRGQWTLFGGGSYSDTWTSDGNTWSLQTPHTAPSARSSSDWDTMVFDPSRDRMILFGGTTDNYQVSLGDTWAWDGNDWTQVAGPMYKTSG